MNEIVEAVKALTAEQKRTNDVLCVIAAAIAINGNADTIEAETEYTFRRAKTFLEILDGKRNLDGSKIKEDSK